MKVYFKFDFDFLNLILYYKDIVNYFLLYNISVKDYIEIGGYVVNFGLKGVDYMESIIY